jgi:hypothetical protein
LSSRGLVSTAVSAAKEVIAKPSQSRVLSGKSSDPVASAQSYSSRKTEDSHVLVAAKAAAPVVTPAPRELPVTRSEAGLAQSDHGINKPMTMPVLSERTSVAVTERNARVLPETTARGTAVAHPHPKNDGVSPEEASLKAATLLDGNDQPSLETESVPPAVQPGGEQVLASIASRSDPVPVSLVRAQQTIVEIGNTVVQRILVHEATGAKSEIFVQLQESVLPKTEIYLLRDGVSLRVDFVAKAGDSVAFLMQNHTALQEYLTQRLESVKEVRVRVYDHSEETFGHSFGRERNRRHGSEEEHPSQS